MQRGYPKLMSPSSQFEVKFTLAIHNLPEASKQEAEAKAKEAYVMTLLRQGSISTGKAASLLEISRLEILSLMGQYNISVFPEQTQEELAQEVAETLQVLETYNP